MAPLPSGTVTFLFTNIEGSTALWERDRPTMASAVDRPAQAEPVAHEVHQLTLGAQSFEEHHQLELEKTTGSMEGRPVSA
jgi:class 3 adenylate cyclase